MATTKKKTTKKQEEIKVSPKVIKLCKWSEIDVVNNMLDAGESPSSVCKYINAQGFKISVPLVYEYQRLRKKAVIDGINIEKLLGIVNKKDDTLVIEKGVTYNSKKTKLKSELDALDAVINKGYQDWLEVWSKKPVALGMMMSAIKLKNELTNNSHNFLTQYGMEQLIDTEKQKYDMLLNIALQYIPEGIRDEVLDKMDIAEDEFYQKTQYYEEYLRSKGLSEEEILQKLKEYEDSQEEDDSPILKV